VFDDDVSDEDITELEWLVFALTRSVMDVCEGVSTSALTAGEHVFELITKLIRTLL